MKKDLQFSHIFMLIFLLFLYKITSFELVNNQEQNIQALSEQKVCDGNRFQYMTSFTLGRQDDLSRTFDIIQKQIKNKTIKLNNVTFSDRERRDYKIFNFVAEIRYFQTKQYTNVRQPNVLNISGANIRIAYNFTWQKKQAIGVPVYGNGTGVVSSDSITFEKILRTNTTHDLQWFYYKSIPIVISNSMTLGTIYPFKQMDYDTINLMVGNSSNQTSTLRNQLIIALNLHYMKHLSNIVKEDKTIQLQKNIQYSYNDYRGEFDVMFTNRLLNNSYTKNGLSLIYSQVIKNDINFQCGEKVPDQPESQTVYGGTQEFISNKLLKSTLIYALRQKFLDSTLSQQNWQSRAFQFFMGDFHDVMYTTKNISSFKKLDGKCLALDDKYFSINMKTNTSYSILVNFSCVLNQNTTKIFDISMPVQIQIQPKINSKILDFIIKDIKGTPTFIESAPKYKISNQQLASFILTQTLNTAKKSTVIGSGYKIRNRKIPRFQVRQRYLFLYDKTSVINNPQSRNQ